MMMFPGAGKPPSSNVCYACGAQGLDVLARIYGDLQVSWTVSGLLSSGV